LLAQWNQQESFTEEKIRDFVNYIEARKGRSVVPVKTAQTLDSEPALLSQNQHTTV